MKDFMSEKSVERKYNPAAKGSTIQLRLQL